MIRKKGLGEGESKSDLPLGLLDTLSVRLGVSKSRYFTSIRIRNLSRRAMTNENWLAPPLDNHVLPLWNRTEVYLDFRESEYVGRSGQVGEKVGHDRLGSRSGDESH